MPDSSSSKSWDVCIVPARAVAVAACQGLAAAKVARHRDPLPDDPVLHICALAYMSDLTLLGSAQVTHMEEQQAYLQVSSLDHAMWFMRAFRADEWLLYDQSSPSAGGGGFAVPGQDLQPSAARWLPR